MDGFCECGCGRETKIAPYSSHHIGWIKGEPIRFIHGHNGRWKIRLEESRIKMSKTMQFIANLPEKRKKNSESKIKYYKNPENRERHRIRCNELKYKVNRKTLFNDPKYREKLSKNGKKLWSNPEYRIKVASSQKEANLDPLVRKNKSESHKLSWQNPEYVRKQMKARVVKPNKQELILDSILQELYPSDWRFVGDGEIILAGKCPDFINVNGRKKIIELFGDYWHKGENPQDRIDIFKSYGYDTLVIWEHELKNIENVKSKIIGFQNE